MVFKLNFMPRIWLAIRKLDSFGHPVNLSLNGEPTYKTTLGGLATLLSRLLILAYFFYEILGVIRKESQIKTTVSNRNLVTDKNVFEVNDTIFDMAFQVSFFSGNETRVKEFQRYVNFVAASGDQYWAVTKEGGTEMVWNQTLYNLIPCPENRFQNASEFTSALGIYENFFCIEDINFKLQGSLSSFFTKQFWITFQVCNQQHLDLYHPGMICESDQEEVRKVISDLALSHLHLFCQVEEYLLRMHQLLGLFANHYFDGEEFSESTLKWNYKTYNFALHPDISNNIQIQLSQNYVQKQISMLTDTGIESEQFLSHRFSTTYIHEVVEKDYPYLSLILVLDEQSTTYERKTKTILEALSNTGGIIGFILTTVGFFIQYFQDFFFNQAVLKRIFLYERKNRSEMLQNQENQNNSEFKQLDVQQEQWCQESSGRSNNEAQLQIQKLEKVMQRVPFEIKFRNFCRHSIPSFGICKRNKTMRKGIRKYKLYKTGVEALNKEFDIAYIVKQIRMLKFMSQVFLSKYQRKLLPYFQRNLISEYNLSKGSTDKLSTQEQQAKIAQYIQILALQQNLSKDQRIIQHLTSSKAASSNSNTSADEIVQHGISKLLNLQQSEQTKIKRKGLNTLRRVEPEQAAQQLTLCGSNRQDSEWKQRRKKLSRGEEEFEQESYFYFAEEQKSNGKEENKNSENEIPQRISIIEI